MTMQSKRSSMLMIIIVLCTITIIGTNYIFTQSVITDVNESIIEREYRKIGGKENYIILQEIQKREIMGYLDKVKEEQPELIEEILNKDSKYKKIKQEIIDDLKKDTSIYGNSGSLITLIEFSDMECDYCIKQHSNGIKDKILEKYTDKVNYIFKNFPLPTHKNAKLDAEAAKCIESLEGKEKYIEYIDTIFSNTSGGGEGYNSEMLTNLAIELGSNKEDFETCLLNLETKEDVEREFTQGRMLGIEAIPANLIINNKTGEYVIITEESNYEDIENVILDISE